MRTTEWVPGLGYVQQDATFAGYGDPGASSAAWWQLMQGGRYRDVLDSPDLTQALGAIGRSGYATDSAYSAKLSRIAPRTPEQQAFWDSRIGELSFPSFSDGAGSGSRGSGRRREPAIMLLRTAHGRARIHRL